MNKKIVTAIGVAIAVAALLVDPSVVAALTAVIGADATTKLAAFGTLVAALGKGLLEKDAK